MSKQKKSPILGPNGQVVAGAVPYSRLSVRDRLKVAESQWAQEQEQRILYESAFNRMTSDVLELLDMEITDPEEGPEVWRQALEKISEMKRRSAPWWRRALAAFSSRKPNSELSSKLAEMVDSNISASPESSS